MRKTKIICTLGPAVDNPEILEQLMLAGMDVARINFSHGNYEEQQDRIERVKEVRKKVNKPISFGFGFFEWNNDVIFEEMYRNYAFPLFFFAILHYNKTRT